MVEFIAAHLAEKHPSLETTTEFIKNRLKDCCLLMFDGVDEVRRDDRPHVRAVMEGLLTEYDHPGLYCLVSSRFSAAVIPEQMPGFERCEIQNVNPVQRSRLIHDWYQAVYPDNLDEAGRKADHLCGLLDNSAQAVRDLAITPLMVTIFAMVHDSRGKLPEQRAWLYEDAVEVLLSEVLFKEGTFVDELARGWETRRDRLVQIAFEFQVKNIEDMLEEGLIDLIQERFGTDETQARPAARQFLKDTAERGGLLEEDDGSYGFFTHRTFQEYLAGRYLAEEYPPDQLEQFLKDHRTDDHWEEAIRLAAGYLSIKGETKADRFIKLLANLAPVEADQGVSLALAGLCLGDVKPDRRLPGTVEWMTGELHRYLTADPALVPVEQRRRIGLALGSIGDPRFPVQAVNILDEHGHEKAVRVIPPETVPVAAGTFQMGTSSQQVELLKAQGARAWPDESPDHPVMLSEFEMGRYPVTNAEFRLFWEDQGYKRPELWSADGWRWRTGQCQPDVSVYQDEDFRRMMQTWLDLRTDRSQPFFWDNPDWNASNLPVVGICWFEAETYCNWLSLLHGKHYRLPTEAEWEKTARSADGRLWPWEGEWDAARCNSGEEGSKETTPVGMYPHGASPYGALDMAGNVWEWCQDWLDEQTYAQRAVDFINIQHGCWHAACNLNGSMNAPAQLFSQICSFENLYFAYRKARKGKRGKPGVAAFEYQQIPSIRRDVGDVCHLWK